METKEQNFTGGEWFVDACKENVHVVARNEDGYPLNESNSIAKFFGPDAMANAQLCAAVRDLLEVAKCIRTQFRLAGVIPEKDSNDPLAMLAFNAEQAIAKATGQATP